MSNDELSYECPLNELALVISFPFIHLFFFFFFFFCKNRKDTINPLVAKINFMQAYRRKSSKFKLTQKIIINFADF